MADQSLLQYLVEQLGGVPTDAASRLLFASSRDAQQARLGQPRLTYEQQLAGYRQGLSPGDMGKVRYEGGKWLNTGNGQPYVSRGNHFDASRLPGAPGSVVSKAYVREPGNESGGGQPNPEDPALPLPPVTPPSGTGAPIPRNSPPPPADPRLPPPPPPPPDPNALPPRNPVTTPPTPMRPPVGTGSTSWVSSPLKSFDPTQLLMALRTATQGGALTGPNSVQSNLPAYLSQAMRSRNG